MENTELLKIINKLLKPETDLDFILRLDETNSGDTILVFLDKNP